MTSNHTKVAGRSPCLRGGRLSLRTSVGPALLAVTLSLLTGCGSEEIKDELPVYCLDKPSKTACSGGTRRYFYDYRKNRCSAFNYCAGAKLFETRERCEDECVER